MRPRSVRGEGYKMINMGELFKYPRIDNPDMELVKLNDREISIYNIEEYDLLFARQSLVLEGAGKCSVVISIDKPSTFESHLIRIRLNKKVAHALFYFYYFSSKTGFGSIQSIVNQVAAAGIRGSDLAKLKVLYPALSTQKKIAAILSAYDDLIENNKRRIALLEKIAEEIYREWFVRFRFPDYQTTEFEKGIPKEWETGKANLFFDHVKGKSYKSDEIAENAENAMPFITLKSFNRGGGYRADGLKAYSGKYNEKQVVFEGDVVMAVTDMTQNREVVGRVARVPDVGKQGAVISLDVIKLVPKTISATYLYSYMKYSGFGNFIKSFANGANVLHLKPDLVTQQVIVMPNKELRNQFEAIVNPIHKQVGYLTKEIINLETTKNMLLPRLISGKLSVEGLDIQFPPSMMEENEL